MTIPGLLWSNRRVYLIMIAFFAIFAALITSVVGNEGVYFVAVAFVVLICRDIGFFRRSAAIWPVLQEVLDWKKIEELMPADPPIVFQK